MSLLRQIFEVQNELRETFRLIMEALSEGRLKSPIADDVLVDGREACRMQQISKSTLIRYRKSNKLSYVFLGGKYRYSVREINELMALHKKPKS